ncbi:hypothetical protein KIPB_001459, partial [Kipferlia bialata]
LKAAVSEFQGEYQTSQPPLVCASCGSTSLSPYCSVHPTHGVVLCEGCTPVVETPMTVERETETVALARTYAALYPDLGVAPFGDALGQGDRASGVRTGLLSACIQKEELLKGFVASVGI